MQVTNCRRSKLDHHQRSAQPWKQLHEMSSLWPPSSSSSPILLSHPSRRDLLPQQRKERDSDSLEYRRESCGTEDPAFPPPSRKTSLRGKCKAASRALERRTGRSRVRICREIQEQGSAGDSVETRGEKGREEGEGSSTRRSRSQSRMERSRLCEERAAKDTHGDSSMLGMVSKVKFI